MERNFNEYWWIILERAENWSNEDPRHENLMKGHFDFISSQKDKGHLFVAIPMSPSGGQYVFDGKLSDEQMKDIILTEPSIGTVFTHQLKRAYISEHSVIFTFESLKRIKQLEEATKKD